MQYCYLSADALLADSFELAFKIVESKFRPDLLVALWRGGSPIGIAMHEVFACLGIECQHFAIRSTSYTGVNQQNSIQLWGMEMLLPWLHSGSKVLLVDDVFDSGRTMAAVETQLRQMAGSNTLEIKLATPWYKPKNNLTTLSPDFYLHTTEDWLVFPHELQGLDSAQLLAKPSVATQIRRLISLQRN